MATEIWAKAGTVTLSGGPPWISVSIISVPGVVTLTGIAAAIEGNLITPSVGTVTLSGGLPYTALSLFRKNWVKWSKIGSLDFEIDKSNVAGERPLDWSGWVWSVLKLGEKVVAYGENGVTFLPPHGIDWGMETVHRIGILGKQAVTGNDKTHFFIDKEYRLFSISDSLKMHDYSEYLSVLTDPVMSYDIERDFVYICDGTYGFVYSPKEESLGTGPVNITGIGSQSGTQYVASPAAITTIVPEVWTDVYDLGTRKLKIVRSVEFDISAVTGTLQAAIEWSMNKGVTFTQTGWQTVDKRGVANISCAGYDLRFGLKLLAYEWIKIGRITVNGEMGSD